MKIIIAFLMSVSLYAASEDYQPLPSTICNVNCDAGSQLVWSKYQALETGINTDLVPGSYTGRCYVGKTSQAIFALFNVLEKEGIYYLNGITTYGAFPNPYARLTEEEALNRITPKFDYKHQMLLNESDSFANMNPGGDVPVKYWVRQDPIDNTLIIVSRIPSGMTFCYMPKI